VTAVSIHQVTPASERRTRGSIVDAAEPRIRELLAGAGPFASGYMVISGTLRLLS
jgi:hypothetical protein